MNYFNENRSIKIIAKVTEIKSMSDDKGRFIDIITSNSGEAKAYQITIYRDNPKLLKFADVIDVGTVLYLEGCTKSYKGREQINTYNIVIIPTQLDLSCFSKRSFDAEDTGFLLHTIYTLDSNYSDLLRYMIGIDGVHNRKFAEFTKCFASANYHGNWIGGLASHTTNMLRLVKAIRAGILTVDRIKLELIDWQILVICVVLHDAMKTCELIPCGDKYIRRDGAAAHHVNIVRKLEMMNELMEFVDDKTLSKITNAILCTHQKLIEPTIEGELLSKLDSLECALSRCVNSILV